MDLDFIQIPYTTAPSMKLNTGAVFISGPDQNIIKQKRLELEKFGNDLHQQLDGSNKIISQAAEFCNVYTDNIVDLALRLEEDVAVMHKGILQAICFCFPSGFIPKTKIGLDLKSIHIPVADNKNLLRASDGIARVMTEKDSFIRHVWTITTNSNLSNHPSNKQYIEINSIDQLYFRHELQTTARVDDYTSLFFVRVSVRPLAKVYCKKILDSINSMSDAVLRYKDLQDIKIFLNNYSNKYL